MAKRGSDGDVLSNKINVMLANHQSLLASLMGPKTETDVQDQQLREEHDDDDFKDETLGHEQLGVGGRIPKDIQDGSFTRRTMTSDDKLLQTLIGKKAAKAHIATKQATKHMTSQPGFRKASKSTRREDSEDEEEGRAASFKSRKRKHNVVRTPTEEEAFVDTQQEAAAIDMVVRATSTEQLSGKASSEVAKMSPSRGIKSEVDDQERAPHKQRPKPGSFLDEILAERSNKKKRRRNKQNVDS